ncbi:type III secretion system chaperone [Pseudomonas sp. SLFW]|uniref:type III secretion system chaperone n=1 Tax=Pseudomonas sp. SLFW TaxID=2683259 RepID=UPI0014127B14|nr:type III secretion system chaperone [Pseudomonas sp. SLFW]NBB11895.1 type III secretion chaperone SrcB [Pseudomonas sp. SLFW]
MATATTLIDALAKQMGITLTLENGVCALFDQQREVVIIEIPTAGDVAILHCRLALRPDPALHEKLLRLNFDSSAMSGCWLALDDRNQVRLCAELPLDGLSELAFVHWVQGFVKQTQEVPALLRPATSAPAAPVMARRFV